MAATASDLLRMQFDDFDSAEKGVIEFCRQEYHPVHVDAKEKVGSFNKKVKEDSRISTLPHDTIYSCRYVFFFQGVYTHG